MFIMQQKEAWKHRVCFKRLGLVDDFNKGFNGLIWTA
jgi:hypothetical protein